ncbi:MAG: hypothetical protein WCI88_01105 [Chloroflexota bacterium]|jgi:hypothetical protein
MKQIPRLITSLILFMAFLMNVSRIQWGNWNLDKNFSFLYVFLPLSIVLIIAIPWLRRLSQGILIITSVLVFLLCDWLIFTGIPNYSDLYSIVTIIEIILLILGIILARSLAGRIVDFEEVIENITLGDLNHVRTLEESIEDIETEFYRSLRHELPMTIMVIEPETGKMDDKLHEAVKEVQNSMMNRYIGVNLLRKIRKQLRRPDLLVDLLDNNRFMIVYPDTSRDTSAVILGKVEESAKRAGILVSCGIASFPDDAVTFDELMNVAEKDLEYSKQQGIFPQYQENIPITLDNKNS